MNKEVNCLICNTKFTSKSNLIKHLNNNKCKKINCKALYHQLEESQKEQIQIVQEPIIEEIKELIQEDQNKIIQLQFDGVFKGREKEIRITPDKQISVFDFIKVVGEQDNPRKTWEDIEKKYKNEVVRFSDNFKFQGKRQKLTPVINV